MAAWDNLPEGSQVEAAGGPGQEARSRELQALRQELHSSCIDAKVGRDVLDPYEMFGFYPSLDFVISPDQISCCQDLFGFTPGLEYAAAVKAAQAQGKQVFCIDAPLKLQEVWVRDILSSCRMGAREVQVQERLRAGDAQALEALIPQDIADWDRALPEEVARRVAELPPPQQQLYTMTAFKVARACAAASVAAPGPGEEEPPSGSGRPAAAPRWAEVSERQARLQPLKHQHMERRALYLGQQLQEVCGRVAAAARAQARAKEAGAAGAERPEGLEGAAAEERRSAGSAPAVLVVLGRQYVPGLRALWADQASGLYRGAVPRTFAASVLEPAGQGAGLDPDVEHGGSRPVGQRVTSLGGGQARALNPE